MKNLKGKNILLRALEPSDMKQVYDWENDVTAWHESGIIVPVSEYTVDAYIRTQDDIYSSKALKMIIEKQGKAIGHVDLFEFDPVNRRAGIGILISESERNKGYACEALDLLIRYGFEILYLHQLYCNIITDNEISLKLFKKHNFEICGCRNDWVLVDGEWKDVYMLQLINNEKNI